MGALPSRLAHRFSSSSGETRLNSSKMCETDHCPEDVRRSRLDCLRSWLTSSKKKVWKKFKFERLRGCFSAGDDTYGEERSTRLYLDFLPVKSETVDLGISTPRPDTEELVQYFDKSPTDLQHEILMRLARSDRVSFVAWSFARRANLRTFQDPGFWKLLLKSQSRIVPSVNFKSLQKLFNLYYRRFFQDENSKVRLFIAATAWEVVNIKSGIIIIEC